MSIKPIDLQTSIGQMHEVAKGEQGKSAAVVEGRHVQEEDSGAKSKQINEKLRENKKAEKTAIRREEEGRKKKKKKKKLSESEPEKDPMESAEKKALKDDKVGLMIDVKR